MEALRMPRTVQYLLAILLLILLIGAPVGYAWHRQAQIRNFRVVREGVLYRSGQMSLDGLKRVIHDYGIKTVVTLRAGANPGDPAPDLAEEEYCKVQEINYHRLPPGEWWAPDGPAPAEESVRKFRTVMADPKNYPVLVHCLAGIHRTGAYCAIYRMEHERWANAEAIAEMKACGYTNLDDEWDILGYLEQYRPSWQEHSSQPVVKRRPPVKPGKHPSGNSRRTPN
jgi:protein tyrosine/serine phosphatase